MPLLESKFRFVLPQNCHVTKSIQAALKHATKIMTAAKQNRQDGDVSIDFGLQMKDGPIDDTLSAHSYQKLHSPS